LRLESLRLESLIRALGNAFVVDAKVDEHYKEAVHYICQTIRLAKELAK